MKGLYQMEGQIRVSTRLLMQIKLGDGPVGEVR